jgi:hypothetical protein
MLQHFMYGRPGWYVLHAVVIGLVFLLGYSVEFFGG